MSLRATCPLAFAEALAQAGQGLARLTKSYGEQAGGSVAISCPSPRLLRPDKSGLAMTEWGVILSVAKNLVPLRPALSPVEGVNSAKNPSHNSGRCLEILRRPNEFGLLRMTLLSALF